MSYPHLARLVHEQAKKYGARTALRYRDYDTSSWIPVTWNQFSNTVEVASRALLELGVAVHENVGIFSQNKPECFYTDFALYAVRAVSVPLYATSSCEQVEYIMRDAGIRYLFVGEQYQYDVACRVAASCPSLCRIIIFDRKVIRHSHDESSLYYNEFLSLGSGHATASELERRMADACDADLANILYTSGTTGESKGVMLHHSCYAEAFRIHDLRLPVPTDEDVVLNFLPLTHIFEKAWTYLCICRGATICINLRPADVLQSIREVRPTAMCAVPRFWEKVYSGVQERIAGSNLLLRFLFRDALRVGRRCNLDYWRVGQEPPFFLRLRYRFYERRLYRLLKQTVGIERGRLFPTAGAAIPQVVEEFVHSVGIPMLAGYGLTESTATVSCDPYPQYTIGSVGRVMPDLEVRIADNGEVLLRGKTITCGYYNKEELTRRAIDAEGWFHTGDAGYFKDGELFLTDRIKDLYKTSNGKYVAPQAIESRLVTDRYIDQIAVIADRRKYVTALIVPVYDQVREYASKRGIVYQTMEELLRHPQVMKLYRERIDRLQQPLAHYEQVKYFTLLPQPFSMERGELTNTLKVKRPVVCEHYATLIEKMYEE